MRIGKWPLERPKRWMTGLGVLAAVVLIASASRQITVPSFEKVRSTYKPSDTWIVDHNERPMELVRIRKEKRSLDWCDWRDVSPAFREILVRVEDQRYFYHPGIDPLAVAKAGWERITGASRRGASTLTMQLVSLLNEGAMGGRKNLAQKLRQMVSALRLNSRWTKEQALEAYINLVPFRGEIVGLRAASLGLFNKNPSGLIAEESAILVALLRSPNADPEIVSKRACVILGANDCQATENLARTALSKPYSIARSRELIPVLSKRFTISPPSSSVIRTSLDYRIQELSINALREQLRSLKNKNVNDGAVLVLETQTGRVVAYAANAGKGLTTGLQIDGVQMRRQAGSTIKPFVYATAFDWKILEPSSLLDDSPADISVAQGRVYHPKNYDYTFRGLVSVADALGSSINVPAVKALQLVGEERVIDRLRSLGFSQLKDDHYYGLSLALGSVDVSLWELTEAYRQLASENSHFSESSREAIWNILASPEHRRFTFGMDSILRLPFPAAVKTGTSKDMRDNWCIGWTDKFTIGVWVGNFNGAPMWNVSGMTGAAPIWRSLMLNLHPHSSKPLAKYEPPGKPLSRKTITRIKYPAPDMFVGIDPDIPHDLQQLPIEVENPQPGDKIFINQALLGNSRKITLWPVEKGRYKVRLVNHRGIEIDSVKIEVR